MTSRCSPRTTSRTTSTRSWWWTCPAGAGGAAGQGTRHDPGTGQGADAGAGDQGGTARGRHDRGGQLRLPGRTRPGSRGSVGRVAPPGQAPGRAGGGPPCEMTRRHMSDPGHTVEPARREHRPGVTGCEVAVKPARQPWLASPGPAVLARGGRPPGTPGARGARRRAQAEGTGGVRVRPVSDLQRRVAPFEVVTDMVPAGVQPRAIAEMDKRLQSGAKDTVLLGATGTGKTATIAWLAEKLQRPTLVMLPNKTLAAQFANELREMLPRNAVEYFVSYYDYYQPEAYVPQTDTYIEKDSSINDEVERLRHSATNSLLTRRDTIVVASVSCIYGLGTPQEYVDRMLTLRVGDTMERDSLLRHLVGMQYARNDLSFTRGTFRVRGDTIEIIPQYEELAVRIEMFGDEIERLSTLHPLTGEVISEDDELYVFPASHYVAGEQRMERAIAGIEAELAERLAELEKQGKLLEAQRLRMRTTYDVEMMRQ